jgi:cell shape-determining protein MreD
MMPVLFAMIGLGLIVLQTTILPLSGVLAGRYDPLVPLVVFLGLQRPLGHGLPVVVLLGVATDNLSGAPPGYFLTAYLWIWALVRLLIRFLRVADTFILPVAMVAAVLVENLVILGIPMLLGGGSLPGTAVETVAWQIVWTLATGPILVVGFAGLLRRLENYQRQVRARRAVQE